LMGLGGRREGLLRRCRLRPVGSGLRVGRRHGWRRSHLGRHQACCVTLRHDVIQFAKVGGYPPEIAPHHGDVRVDAGEQGLIRLGHRAIVAANSFQRMSICTRCG